MKQKIQLNQRRTPKTKVCKVGYEIFELVYVPKLLYKKEQLRGLINIPKSQITISNDQSKNSSKQTLIHEVIHGMESVYNLPMDEEFTDKLATAFMTFIQDNPVLIDHLRTNDPIKMQRKVNDKKKRRGSS